MTRLRPEPHGLPTRPASPFWLAVFLLASGVAAGCGPVLDPGSGEPGERESAPDFKLERLDGGAVQLSDLQGKTVVIDFWATWCPPCEFQVPELNAFYEAHRDEGDLEVLGVSIDTDGPDVVGAWTAEKNVRYPVLLGDDDLARRFGAVGFPTLIVVTPDGMIDSRHVGLIERDDLEEALERLRESHPTPAPAGAPAPAADA